MGKAFEVGDRVLWWKPGTTDPHWRPHWAVIYRLTDTHAAIVFDAPHAEGKRHDYRMVGLGELEHPRRNTA